MDNNQRVVIIGLILFSLCLVFTQRYFKHVDEENSRMSRVDQTAKHLEQIAKEIHNVKTP